MIQNQAAQALKQYIQDFPGVSSEGWSIGDVDKIVGRCTERFQVNSGAYILRYDRAEINGETIFSCNYDRTRSRASYWIQVDYGGVPWVARVNYFLKVPHPTDSSVVTLRLAVVTFFKPEVAGQRSAAAALAAALGQRRPGGRQRAEAEAEVTLLRVPDITKPPTKVDGVTANLVSRVGTAEEKFYPIDPSTIKCKLVSAIVGGADKPAKEVYFMPYFNMTSR